MSEDNIYYVNDLKEKISNSGLLGKTPYCRVMAIVEDGNIKKAIFIPESGCDAGNTIYLDEDKRNYQQMLCDECLIDLVWRGGLQIVAIGQMIATELKLDLRDIIITKHDVAFLKLRDIKIEPSRYLSKKAPSYL